MQLRLRAVAVLAGLATAACAARAPVPDPTTAPVEIRSYTQGALRITLRIPALPPGPKPAVLSPFVDTDTLLARGFVVAEYRFEWAEIARLKGLPPPAPDPPAPPDTGQRVGAWLLSSPRAGIVGRAYFQLVAASAGVNVPAVVDRLVRQPEVDPERIAILGSSTFGFVALEAMREDPRLAVGIVRVACGDYETFLRASTLALGDDPRWLVDGRAPLDADYEAELHAHQPIDHADAYPPRPLLLLAGRSDPVMPYECVERTQEALGAAYARAGVADRFRVESFSEEGHQLGAESDALALDWLVRWLQGPEAPR
ncbi:MAG TPA: prolyl oligopeptidase family serine peptidase [Myxococcota bacterium]|nr:prolyl oligopeptidase family serine peptidase [Myxococcota bacterium]